MKILVPLTLACAILSGCAQQTFVMNGNGSAPEKNNAQHFFVGGIGQTKTIDAAEVCGGIEKVEKVESQTTFLNGLIGLVTFSIYTPRQARVYCK